MPNWCRNTLAMKGIAGEERLFKDGEFSLDAIIPMPGELEIEDSTWTEKAALLALAEEQGTDGLEEMSPEGQEAARRLLWNCSPETFRDILGKARYTAEKLPEDRLEAFRALGARALSNIRRYGHKTWYGWRCVNWGTKWEPWQTEVCGEDAIEFFTAWGPPLPVIAELSAQYPGRPVTITWLAEGGPLEEQVVSFLNGEET